MGRACSVHWRDKKCIQNFGQKPERKRPLGNPGHRWENNSKMDTVIGFVNIIHHPEIGTSSVDGAQLSRFHLKTKTASSLRMCVLNKKQDNG
jgi:hypothetical protein